MSCISRTGLISQEEFKEILSSHDNEFIESLDYSKQRQAVTAIAESIYRSSLETGKAEPKVIKLVIQKFTEDVNENITKLNSSKSVLDSINEDGSMNDSIAYLSESIKDNDIVLNNIDKLTSLAYDVLHTFSGVTVKRINDLPNTKTDLNEENEAGLERTSFSDTYQLELNSRDTMSSRIKKFLAFVSDYEFVEDDIVPVTTFIGTTAPLNFEYVFNELHRLLDGVEATEAAILTKLNTLIEEDIIPNKINSLAWVVPFIEYLTDNKTPKQIRREFVSEMAKHAVNMGFVMYDSTYDEMSKTYNTTTRVYSDNSSSTVRRIHNQWVKAHGNSDILVNNIYSQQVKDELIEEVAVIRALKDGNIKALALGNLLNRLGITPNPEYLNSLFTSGNRVYYSKGSSATGGALVSQGGILDRVIREIPANTSIDVSDFMSDSLITGLAYGSSKYTRNEFDNAFRVEDKIINTYTNNHYLSNRARDLKTNPDSVSQLQKALFSKDSLYLTLMSNEDIGFKDWFDINYVSLNPLKHKKKKRRSGKTTELSPLDMEVVKLGMFNSGRKSSPIEINGATYSMRKSQFFFLTNSDKSRIMRGNGYAVSATEKITTRNKKGDSNIKTQLTKQAVDLMYNTVVKPEIERIFNVSQPGFNAALNLATYNGGLFYMFPSLNSLEVTYKDSQEKRLLLDIISENHDLDNNTTQVIRKEIESIIIQLTDAKINSWVDLGILDNNKAVNMSKYIERIKHPDESRKLDVKETAFDFVYNYLLFNANMFQTVIGDPAQYFKKDVEITADNIFKRLSAEIAPGMEMEGKDYIQLYANDRVSSSKYIEEYTKLLGSKAKAYTDIEGTDAQEYTTWKEHLNTLLYMGRISDAEHTAVSKAFNEGKNPSKKLFDKVLQPLKPVYVNNEVVGVGSMWVDKKTYIKSSTFPLIPTLTKGLEIDKLRLKLQQLETTSGKGVRLAYRTATKVGFPSDALTIFDEQGNITDFEIPDGYWQKNINKRQGLRIQQDIPYDSKKQKITSGSQEKKLLWSNLLNIKGFVFEENSYTGNDLYKVYVDTYKELYLNGLAKLKSRFTNIKGDTNLEMVSNLLKQELKSRGETSKALLDGLTVEDKTYIENGLSVIRKDFKVPLWLSPYADKYMSLLSSLVKNNVVSQKLQGTSLILGSNEGFKTYSSIEESEETGIIFTDSFKGELQPQHIDSRGVVQPAQVIIPFKFRDTDGNLLKAENFTTKDELGRTIIDSSKLPKDILKSFGFRIPTQLHASMSYMEIVGFLPTTSGDLIIAPREFVVQMGSDFDVDKLYSYLYHTQYDPTTKALSKTSQILEYKTQIKNLKASVRETRKAINVEVENSDVIYSYIDNQLTEFKEDGETVNANKFGEHVSKVYPNADPVQIKNLVADKIAITKLDADYIGGLHNRLLDIHMSVVSNKAVQASMANPLGFGDYFDTITYTEKEYEGYVDLIDSMQPKDKLSSMMIDEAYQTKKFYDGTAGKDGIGMFSSDSIFNVLAQGKNLVVTELVQQEDAPPINVPITVKFGNTYNVSQGSLSEINSLKKKDPRLKTEVVAAAQNLSVDNANEQGMHKVNMNTFTFGAYSILNFLGFEEDISAPFMSQPIIVEYVKRMRQSKSILKPYVPNVEESIIRELKNKYLSGDAYNSEKDMSLADFSGKNATNELLSMIEDPTIYSEYGKHQAAILDKFMWLKAQEKKVAPLKQYLNIDSKGFHKNMYFNKKRINSLDTFADHIILNADKLFGTYSEEVLTGNIKSVTIEPTTLAGLDNIYGTKELLGLFGNLFIESNPLFQFDTIASEIAEVITDTGQLNVKEVNAIREAYRSYLMSNFNVDNVNNLRKDLYTSKQEGSLYSNLQKLKDTSYWTNSIFLNSLEVDFVDGILSIDYNNAGGDLFDETNVYLSFIDLFRQNSEINGVIPSIVGEDLVKYTLMRGDIKSKQFIKLVPPEIISKLVTIPSGINAESYFIDQYFRNNPNKLPTVEDYSEVNKTTIKLTGSDIYPGQYIKTDKEDEVKIYKYNKATSLYNQISKLGSDTFTEYSIQPNNVSILKSNNVKEAELKKVPITDIVSIKLQNANPGGIETTTEVASEKEYVIDSVLSKLDFTSPNALIDSIVATNYTEFSELAKAIKDSLPKGLNINLVENDRMSYDSDSFTITYGMERMKELNNKDLLSSIIHELIHAVTVDNINLHINGQQLDGNITGAINRLTSYKNNIILNLNQEQETTLRNVMISYMNSVEENKLQAIIADTTVSGQIREWSQTMLQFKQDPTTDIDGSVQKLVDEASITDYTRETTIAYYALLNTKEFMAVSSTTGNARELFESITGDTYIEQIKQFFNSILEALGITTEVSKSIIDDILRVAEVSKKSTKVTIIKDIVERNKDDKALFKFSDGNTYFINENSVYFIGNPTKSVFNNLGEQRSSFINKYISALKSTVEYSLNEFEDSYPRPFSINGIRYDSVKEFDGLDTYKALLESFKQNPKFVAKLIHAVDTNTTVSKKYKLLYTDLLKEFGFTNTKIITTESEITDDYSKYNLPKVQEVEIDLDIDAAKHTNKMIGDDTDAIKAFNTTSSSLLTSLDKEGEELRNKCKGGKPIAAKGLKQSNFKLGSSWKLVKDLKGLPSHAKGGVDVRVESNKVVFNSKQGSIEAKYGLFISKYVPKEDNFKERTVMPGRKWNQLFNYKDSKMYASKGAVIPSTRKLRKKLTGKWQKLEGERCVAYASNGVQIPKETLENY